MKGKCFVLRVVHTTRGEVAILDFPQNEKPYIGMSLVNSSTLLSWKIIGIGLPIIIRLLEEKIDTHYNNSIVWDCLLNPIGHSIHLKVSDILVTY